MEHVPEAHDLATLKYSLPTPYHYRSSTNIINSHSFTTQNAPSLYTQELLMDHQKVSLVHLHILTTKLVCNILHIIYHTNDTNSCL